MNLVIVKQGAPPPHLHQKYWAHEDNNIYTAHWFFMCLHAQ